VTVAERLRALGLALPQPMKPPPGAKLPFAWVRVVGNRALVSGHGPTNPDGTLAQPLGKVGAELPFRIPVEIEAEVLLRG
jgi:hypothetical protein